MLRYNVGKFLLLYNLAFDYFPVSQTDFEVSTLTPFTTRSSVSSYIEVRIVSLINSETIFAIIAFGVRAIFLSMFSGRNHSLLSDWLLLVQFPASYPTNFGSFALV